MNNTIYETLYREALTFLTGAGDNDLKTKLKYPETIPADTMKALYRLLLNTLTTKRLKGIIGGVDNLAEPLFDFDPVRVQTQYGENQEQLSREISTNGDMKVLKPFCSSAIWGACFLSEIGSAPTFHGFVEKFISKQLSFSVLPLLLQEEIRGLTFSMACEFLTDSGYPDYVKPNTKIKQLLYDIGAIEDKDNYELLKFMKIVADRNNTTPWAVNQIFWLISSGTSNQKVTFSHHIAPIICNISNS